MEKVDLAVVKGFTLLDLVAMEGFTLFGGGEPAPCD